MSQSHAIQNLMSQSQHHTAIGARQVGRETGGASLRRGGKEAREVAGGGEGGVPQGGADANHDARQHLWFARWGGGKGRREKSMVRTAREKQVGRAAGGHTHQQRARRGRGSSGRSGPEVRRQEGRVMSQKARERRKKGTPNGTQRKARSPRESTRALPRDEHAGTTGCSLLCVCARAGGGEKEENLIEVDVVASARHPLLIQDLCVADTKGKSSREKGRQPGAVSACFLVDRGRARARAREMERDCVRETERE